MPSKHELLEDYRRNLMRLRNASNLINEEFDEIVEKSLKNLAKKHKKIPKTSLIFGYSSGLLILLFLYVLLNVHQPTSSIVLRNVQGLTYPALKIVRSLSVPIIKLFPSLTDLYDETCLVENPHFYVTDMECWPCQNVHSVINLTNIKTDFKNVGDGTPFIALLPQSEITLESLQNVTSQSLLMKEIQSFKTAISKTINKEGFWNSKLFPKDSHFQWRINKMSVARELRKLFKRPYFVPERSGRSVERFLILDGSSAKFYALPNTECGNVFLIQGSGDRTLVLKPSRECQNYCKTVSVTMKPSYALSYNWYHWRPISLPVENSTNPSITYISSYC